jgi:hypothetical protein
MYIDLHKFTVTIPIPSLEGGLISFLMVEWGISLKS